MEEIFAGDEVPTLIDLYDGASVLDVGELAGEELGDAIDELVGNDMDIYISHPSLLGLMDCSVLSTHKWVSANLRGFRCVKGTPMNSLSEL